jgi:hypothetical protein
MANNEQVKILKEAGISAWKRWRVENPSVSVDFRNADLRGLDLRGADLSMANLDQADLRRANLLTANLTKASLRRADLRRVDFTDTKLIKADLTGANLTAAILVDTLIEGARFNRCRVYGISAWGLKGEPREQRELVISSPEKSTEQQVDITIDNIRVAQFVHLLLSSAELRSIIDTITCKVVLILGRFTPERKAVLDAIRGELRNRNYTPVLFDFDGPVTRDITETVSTLAHLARFVIADITDAKSVPQELMAIIPHLPSVPVQPLLRSSDKAYSMFEHFQRYHWVLPTCFYSDVTEVIANLADWIIVPAETKVAEQLTRKS